MPAMTRMRASEPGDAPTELTQEYYRQRASNGRLIIAEATQISPQGKGYPRPPGIYTPEQVAAWATAIHRRFVGYGETTITRKPLSSAPKARDRSGYVVALTPFRLWRDRLTAGAAPSAFTSMPLSRISV